MVPVAQVRAKGVVALPARSVTVMSPMPGGPAGVVVVITEPVLLTVKGTEVKRRAPGQRNRCL